MKEVAAQGSHHDPSRPSTQGMLDQIQVLRTGAMESNVET